MVFRPPAGLLPPEAEIVEFFASFWDDFAVKSVDFSMQNAKSKYQIPKIFACSTLVLIRYRFNPPPYYKKGILTVRVGNGNELMTTD